MAEQRSYDRVPNFSGGMDSYKYAADLPPNQSQLLQNFIVLDNGRAVTRPGADKLGGTQNNASAVQGMFFFNSFAVSPGVLVSAQGGHLYDWDGSAWHGPLAFNLNSAQSPFVAAQVNDLMLLSDGAQAMQYWDGTTFTAASSGPGDQHVDHAPSQVTILTSIAGMFVCAGTSMKMGNGGGVQTFPPDALIFSNFLPTVASPGTTPSGQWLNTQSFRVGNGDGDPIIAVAPLQSVGSSSLLPNYNLAVMKQNSVWIVSIYPNSGSISTWFTPGTFAATPVGNQIGGSINCVGKNAFAVVGDDLHIFTQNIGIISMERSEATEAQYSFTEPISVPIQTYIDRVNWAAASGIQGLRYKNLVLWYVPLDGSTVNNYTLVFNTFISQWTVFTGWMSGAAVVTRFNGQLALVMGNSDGTVNEWKDAQNQFGLDATYLDNGQSIQQVLNTRAMVFGSLDFQKKLRSVLIRFNQGNASVNLSAFLDLADSDDWQQGVSPGGVILPAILPFNMGIAGPAVCWRDLEGLNYANEFYLSMTVNTGWIDCRGIVAVAFLKPLRDPNA